VKKTAGTVLRLAVISGLNPGPLMDADGPLMEQPSAPVVVLALGWANGVSALPTIPSTSKIYDHHST
jgi:hypothetical protein